MVEGAPHTAKERSVDQLLCPGVPPAPIYKGARGEEAGPRRGRAKGSPTPSRTPSFLVGVGEGGKEEEEGKKRGGRRPLPLSYSD